MEGRGMTIKQYERARFFELLEVYRMALALGDNDGIVRTSLALYACRYAIPQNYWPMVGRVFRKRRE